LSFPSDEVLDLASTGLSVLDNMIDFVLFFSVYEVWRGRDSYWAILGHFFEQG
jgi:hypothetical protein